MIIIGCSHGVHIAKKIADNIHKPYSKLTTRKFPDSELYIRYNADVKGKVVVLVQSFYENVDDCLVEVMFAAESARSQGAKKIILLAPYMAYFRQDARFHKGEIVSLKRIAKNIGRDFDGFYVVDPHLHRVKKLSDIFKIKAACISANPLIENHIKKSIKNPLIIGPDLESYEWAEVVARRIGCGFAIMEKKRLGDRNVKVTLNKDIDLRKHNLVFIDDMISTGHTLLEAIKSLKKLGAKNCTCFAVHGILVENALEKLKKAGAKVITTNTIPNKAAKIDVSGIIAKSIKP